MNRPGEILEWMRAECAARQYFQLPKGRGWALTLAGTAAAAAVFAAVMLAPPHPFHPWRHAELLATYATYGQEGALLVKSHGTGSPATQWPTPSAYTYAVFDDDPGIYAAASLIGRAAGLEDPYQAIGILQATTAALPWLFLPLLMARLFLRPAAGFAALAAIPLYVMASGEWAIVGSDYGRDVSGWEVYGLYGVAGSLVFLGLVGALACAVIKRTLAKTLGLSVALGIIAAAANMTRAVSGFAILAATAVAFLIAESRWRHLAILALPVLIVILLPATALAAIDSERARLTGLAPDQVPTAHALWHTTYLGLGYIGYGSEYEEPNPFGIRWSDEFGWEAARSVQPDVQIHSPEYEEIIKDLYFSAVGDDPIVAVKGYLLKTLDVLVQNGAVLLLIATVGLFANAEGGFDSFGIAVILAVPVVVMGMAPPVVVMPFRYFFVELTAGLSLLFLVALCQGASLIWRRKDSASG